jgi:4-hydroxy-tetrahydrodipicolinate reductase
MIKVIVTGAYGKMGRTVCEAVMAEQDLELAAAVDTAFSSQKRRDDSGLAGIELHDNLDACLEATADADVAVDFTIPDHVFKNVTSCIDAGVSCVVGTTGLTHEQLDEIDSTAKKKEVGCLVAPNFAIGAVLMMEVSKIVARYMPSCEIVELHHDRKLDAPSGTALRTAELIAADRKEDPDITGPERNAARGITNKGVPIHSVRLPGMVAHQEVIFGGKGQTLSVRHDSISRESFMPGVIMAVRQVTELDGLVVGLENIM